MALSADDVARYHAEGYLLPEAPMRAMSAEEAQAVRHELEELEKRVGVTANKVRTSVHPTVHFFAWARERVCVCSIRLHHGFPMCHIVN
jgi:hypothetical protein